MLFSPAWGLIADLKWLRFTLTSILSYFYLQNKSPTQFIPKMNSSLFFWARANINYCVLYIYKIYCPFFPTRMSRQFAKSNISYKNMFEVTSNNSFLMLTIVQIKWSRLPLILMVFAPREFFHLVLLSSFTLQLIRSWPSFSCTEKNPPKE